MQANEVPNLHCFNSFRCMNEYMANDSHLYHLTNSNRPVIAERPPHNKILGALSSCKVATTRKLTF